MVAIVTGSGLGLQNSSRSVLGLMGQLGNAALGRSGENVFVNAATGNLVVQRQDEFLVGLGPDLGVSRTYNSLANPLDDDNNDNWLPGFSKTITNLTGTLNTVGSTVTRADWDGSTAVY